MWHKGYSVELYGKDDLLQKEWLFEKKTEQLEMYYALLNRGYEKGQIVKNDKRFIAEDYPINAIFAENELPETYRTTFEIQKSIE
jgi:hypothetical protein